jgi:hypothetical protein
VAEAAKWADPLPVHQVETGRSPDLRLLGCIRINRTGASGNEVRASNRCSFPIDTALWVGRLSGDACVKLAGSPYVIGTLSTFEKADNSPGFCIETILRLEEATDTNPYMESEVWAALQPKRENGQVVSAFFISNPLGFENLVTLVQFTRSYAFEATLEVNCDTLEARYSQYELYDHRRRLLAVTLVNDAWSRHPAELWTSRGVQAHCQREPHNYLSERNIYKVGPTLFESGR